MYRPRILLGADMPVETPFESDRTLQGSERNAGHHFQLAGARLSISRIFPYNWPQRFCRNQGHPVYPRFIERRLKESLLDTRVVLLSGPRQSGKTTLAE